MTGSGSDDAAEKAIDPASHVRSTRQRQHQSPGRTKSVNARFTVEEYEAIVAAANAQDLSPTAYVGVTALAAACDGDVPGDSIRHALAELAQIRATVVRIAVAANKLAAKSLGGREVTAVELAAEAEATVRSVARIVRSVATVHRRLTG